MDKNKSEINDNSNSIIENIDYNLKEQNEDNFIESYFNEEKEESNYTKNKKAKYRLAFDDLIRIIKGRKSSDYISENLFYCNLMLMSSYIELPNKLICLSLYSNYSVKIENTYLISNKFEKYLEYFNNIDLVFPLNVFNSAAVFLLRQKNYFYAYKYILKCKELIINNSKISKSGIEQINNNANDIEDQFINYIKSKEKLFNDEDFYPEEKCKKIRELIDLIISEKYNIDTKEINYIYAINKEWLIKVKLFIEPFLTKDDKNNLIKGSFEPNYVFNHYFNKDEKKKSNYSYPAYPGPINNYSLLSFKDCWKDNINLEENIFFNKNLEKNKDYIFVNYYDWNFLNQIFDSTNEIKRKINNLDLTEIKFLLIDKRITAKDKNVNLLKQRYIQINKNSTMIQLKNKIINCVNGELKVKDNKIKKNKQDLCFYILNKDQKDILFEIIISFVYKFQMYESIYIEKIEFQDDNNLSDLFFKYNHNKHILILEIINKDNFNFLVQMDNNYKCNICGEKIKNLDNKYDCDICHFSLFCSQKCANNSSEHRELDERLKNRCEEFYGVSDLLSMEFDSIISRGTKLGRIGLYNPGNLCYFNSVLQCLSNTVDLTKYFLSKIYKNETKQYHFSDDKGILSQAYFKLIDQMWNSYDNQDYKNPLEFKDSFSTITKFFLNQEQQDPYEFLLALLDNLNKDLNRVNYEDNIKIEEQKENETDEKASDRFWRSYKKKNDSVIVDLFQGQFKTIIQCSSCGTTYNEYNIYKILDLPIPLKKSQSQIKFLTNNGNYIELNIKIDEKIFVKDIILKAIAYLNKKNYINLVKKMSIKNNLFNYNVTNVPEKVLYNNMQFIELNKEHKIVNIFKPNYDNININTKTKNNTLKDFPIDNLKYLEFNSKKNSELILYEKDINSNLEDYLDIYVFPITEIESISIFANIIKTNKILSYPVIISIKKTDNLKNLQILIFKKLKKILYNQEENQINTIEICYPHFNDKWDNFKIRDGKCPICKKVYDKKTQYCSLFDSFTQTNSVLTLINNHNQDIPLIIYARSCFYNQNSSIYNGIELFFDKKNEIKPKKNITIYDSLEVFSSKQILDGDNILFCKKCNKKRKAEKKIELYRTPNYLIIQLKRFKQKRKVNGKTILGNKNDIFIEYKEILNLKEYIVGPDKNKSIYDLYGVILHKKFVNTHFISYCKNFGIWISYDDTEINAIESPINKDAYLLFYKRRV